MVTSKGKHTALSDDQQLALKVSFFNAIGFFLTVLVTTYADATLTTLAKYGARTYPYGYWSLLLSIPILIMTYYCVSMSNARLIKCASACLPTLVAGFIAVMWVFIPGFPHANITTWVIAYCAVSILTIGLRYEEPDLGFVSDSKVSIAARIAALKININIWGTLTIALSAGYLALVATWIDKAWANSGQVVTSNEDKVMLVQTQVYEIAIFSLYVIIGPIKECMSKALKISRLFKNISETASNQNVT
jgi:hypothetical protein